jgi:hypothetical protein
MSNTLSNSKEKHGFISAVIGFFNSWGGRIGVIVGFGVIIAVRLIQKDDFDGNLFVTVMSIVICGLAGAIIGKIVIFIKRVIKERNI